ncbi:MAG: orotate phosphoribosyltransferase [Thermoplasmatota archaeon]
MDLRRAIVDCGAIRFGKFVLASGAESDYYIDIKKASSRPAILRVVGDAVAKECAGCDGIAGMELGAVPIAVAASLASGLPYIIVRKKPKGYGTASRIEGDLPAGAKILLVEDVTTSGGSALEAAAVLKEAGYQIDRCVTVVDRESGAGEKFQAAGIRLVPLVRVSELLADGKR